MVTGNTRALDRASFSDGPSNPADVACSWSRADGAGPPALDADAAPASVPGPTTPDTRQPFTTSPVPQRRDRITLGDGFMDARRHDRTGIAVVARRRRLPAVAIRRPTPPGRPRSSPCRR